MPETSVAISESVSPRFTTRVAPAVVRAAGAGFASPAAGAAFAGADSAEAETPDVAPLGGGS